MRVERGYVVLRTGQVEFSAYLEPVLEVVRDGDAYAVYQDDGVSAARVVGPDDIDRYSSAGSTLFLFLKGGGLTLILTLPEGKSEQDI